MHWNPTGLQDKWKEVVEQRDMLKRQLRVSLTSLVTTRAQMELERKTLSKLSERTCMALDASASAVEQPQGHAAANTRGHDTESSALRSPTLRLHHLQFP